MANALFTKGKEAILSGSIDLTSDTIKVALIDTDDDAPNLSTDDNLDDISGAVVATSGALTNCSVTGGTFDADDVTFSSVSGDESEALVVFKDSGSADSSPLIAYIDTGNGLPVTPNGGTITIQWNASGIFSI